jgi:hypothetical protein
MAILWALLIGLVSWVVLWSIGAKSFDAFLITVAIVAGATGWRLFKPFLERQLGRAP